VEFRWDENSTKYSALTPIKSHTRAVPLTRRRNEKTLVLHPQTNQSAGSQHREIAANANHELDWNGGRKEAILLPLTQRSIHVYIPHLTASGVASSPACGATAASQDIKTVQKSSLTNPSFLGKIGDPNGDNTYQKHTWRRKQPPVTVTNAATAPSWAGPTRFGWATPSRRGTAGAPPRIFEARLPAPSRAANAPRRRKRIRPAPRTPNHVTTHH